MSADVALPTRAVVLQVPHPGHPESGRCGRCALVIDGTPHLRNGWIYCDADCAAPYSVPAKDCCGLLTGDVCNCGGFGFAAGVATYGTGSGRG